MRTVTAFPCPDCNETPKENETGKLTCACEGKQWERTPAIKGTEEDERLLASMGFVLTTDREKDIYYWSSPGIIIHLYPGNEWSCDSAPEQCQTLEGYVEWLATSKRENRLQ